MRHSVPCNCGERKPTLPLSSSLRMNGIEKNRPTTSDWLLTSERWPLDSSFFLLKITYLKLKPSHDQDIDCQSLHSSVQCYCHLAVKGWTQHATRADDAGVWKQTAESFVSCCGIGCEAHCSAVRLLFQDIRTVARKKYAFALRE